MDSVTQLVLGGTVTYAAIGNKVGRKAALYGAVLGTLPDLDVLIDFGGAVENFTYHRSFSHSLLVQLALTPLLAWGLTALHSSTYQAHTLHDKPATKHEMFKRWCLAI